MHNEFMDAHVSCESRLVSVSLQNFLVLGGWFQTKPGTWCQGSPPRNDPFLVKV